MVWSKGLQAELNRDLAGILWFNCWAGRSSVGPDLKSPAQSPAQASRCQYFTSPSCHARPGHWLKAKTAYVQEQMRISSNSITLKDAIRMYISMHSDLSRFSNHTYWDRPGARFQSPALRHFFSSWFLALVWFPL